MNKLSATPDAEARDSGTISFVFLNEEEKKENASIRLTKEDYDTAIEAHKEGKTVKIVGTLVSGQRKKTIDYNFFEVLD
jgi:hypothetical protein